MGDGIQLTPDPCKYSWNASAERVVQEYIGEPILLDGLKFDLRLYVLVTATHPTPVAYLYREGLARFAVDSYVAPSRENMKNVHMHVSHKCGAPNPSARRIYMATSASASASPTVEPHFASHLWDS